MYVVWMLNTSHIPLPVCTGRTCMCLMTLQVVVEHELRRHWRHSGHRLAGHPLGQGVLSMSSWHSANTLEMQLSLTDAPMLMQVNYLERVGLTPWDRRTTS